MTTTSFEATSRSGIFPSGDAFDLVIPGMFRVVAWGRARGVWDALILSLGEHSVRLMAVYDDVTEIEQWRGKSRKVAYPLGEPGAVEG